MKAIDFREKEAELCREIMDAILAKIRSLGQIEINMSRHELNCPCINSEAPEHALHTIASVEIDIEHTDSKLNFTIDDQALCYKTEMVPLEAAIDLLDQIEDLTKEDFKNIEQ